MIIKSLKLINIKSHKETEVFFQPGINAIIGKNGCGKTTILEAIGSVLFQSLDYKQKNFIRDGETFGSITLVFILNKKEYTIHKDFGSNSEYYIEHHGKRLVEQNAEIVMWLHQQMLIDGSVDMTQLFQDVIGVPQGMQTSHFLLPPSARKKIFDPILNIEAYADAWKRLLPVSNISKDNMQSLEVNIGTLEGKIDGLHDLQTEEKEVENESGSIMTEFEISQTKLVKLSTKYEKLSEMEKISIQIPGLEEKITLLRDSLGTASKKLDDIKNAKLEIKELQQDFDSQIGIEAEIELLKQKMYKNDQIEEKIGEIQMHIDELDDRNTDIEKDLLEYDKVKTLADDFTSLESKFNEMKSKIDGAEAKTEHMDKYQEHTDNQECPILGESCPKDNLKRTFDEMLNHQNSIVDELREKLKEITDDYVDSKRAKFELSNLDALIKESEANVEELKLLRARMKLLNKDEAQDHKDKIEFEKLNENLEALDDPHSKIVALEERVSTKEDIEIEIELLTENVEDNGTILKEYKKKIKDFDKDTLESVSNEKENLTIECSKLEERFEGTKGKLRSLRESIQDKLANKELLLDLQSKLSDETDVLDMINDIRSIMKKIPEFLVEQYLRHINYEANYIWQDITGRDSSIAWLNNYELTVEGKIFSQLSGGEQMMAALAIRLALLKNLTEIDIAIFDEPTVNLDEEHRIGLAEMIQRIEGFEQLFVVSHDDTFDTVIENVIHITKINGESSIV